MAEVKMHNVKERTFEERFDEGPSEKSRPTLHLSPVDFPEGKKWENEKNYKIEMVVKQTASSRESITLEILKVGGGPAPKERFSRRRKNG